MEELSREERLQQLEEERKRAEEEYKRKEEERKQKAEEKKRQEEERKRKEREERAKKREARKANVGSEEEEKKKKEEEEEKKRQEEEEAKKKAEEEEKRLKKEEEERELELRRKRLEEMKIQRERERKEDEERKRIESEREREEEEKKKKQEDEERRIKEEYDRREKELKDLIDDELKRFEDAKKEVFKAFYANHEKRKQNLALFREKVKTLHKEEAERKAKRASLPPTGLKYLHTTRDQPVPQATAVKLTKALLFEGGSPVLPLLKTHLLRQGKLETDAAVELVTRATEIMKSEPNLLELQPPLILYGDVHGQFYDLVNMLASSGEPGGDNKTTFLFMGDYVDRGHFGSEICLYLYALKIKYPKQIYLIRGNHESRTITTHYDFKMEAVRKYGLDMYELFIKSFEALPLAAVIKTAQMGRFFCVHGGLSPSVSTMDHIREIDRFQEVPLSGSFCDLLWSDPIEVNAENVTEADIEDRFSNIGYQSNVTRGAGFKFGLKAVKDFLAANDFTSIIRAHEVYKEGHCLHLFGYEKLGMKNVPGFKYPPVMTVFSAPNYCGKYGNKATFLRVNDDKYEFQQFEAVKSPFTLPGFHNAITYTLPFVVENCMTAIALMMTAFIGEEKAPETAAERKAKQKEEVDEAIRHKILYLERLAILMKHRREKMEENVKSDQMDKLKEIDAATEKKINDRKKRLLLFSTQRTQSCRF